MSNQKRVQAGVPSGGQFAQSTRGEAGVGLADPVSTDCPVCSSAESSDVIAENGGMCESCRIDLEEESAAVTAAHVRSEAYAEAQAWGDVTHVQQGSRTPWGSAQYVDHPMPGIVSVGCAGHGGIKLSPERNREIPPALRNASGWYEEDCEAQIVGMYFPDSYPKYREAGVDDADMSDWRQAQFESSVKNWFPDQYTKATGIEVSTEESTVLRERAAKQSIEEFRAQHEHEFVTLGNGDNHSDWLPEGYAACTARMDATGEERTFLMPRSEVIHDGMYGRHVLVDPDRHLDVTDVVNARPERPWTWDNNEGRPAMRGDNVTIDYSGLTAAQADRARAELDKVWRFPNDDGTFTTESMGDHLARVGVVGKHPYVDGDKVTYSVSYDGSRGTRVSKAVYDALTGVPDTSDAADKAYLARERARIKYERARNRARDTFDPNDRAKMSKAKAEWDAAGEKHQVLADEKRERARVWQAERVELQKAKFAELAASKGFGFDG